MPSALDSVRETEASIRLVFTNANLRRVNLALIGSLIGDGAYSTAVTVFAYTYGGAGAVAAYVVVRLGLSAVVLPFSSVLIDRLPRKLFMIGTDLIRAVLVGIAALTIWLSGPPIAVLAIAVLAGLVGAPFRPAQQAILPSLADTPQELTAANGVASTLESLSVFVGPALGALLLGVADVPAVFVLQVATFIWSASMISRLVLPAPVVADDDGGSEPPDEPENKESFASEVSAGFRTIGQDGRLRLLVLLCCAQTLVTGASMVFTVLIADDVVGIGARGVGFLNAVMGIGSIIGGLVAISRSGKGSLAQDFGLGVFLWALPPVLVSIWPSPAVAFAAFAVIGLANPLVDISVLTLFQRLTPNAVLGRVFGALESSFIAAMGLGALLMPVLLSLIGLRGALAAISIPILVLVLVCVPGLRRIDRTVNAPEHLDLVQALPLFHPLSPAVQEWLAHSLTPVRLAPGDVVIREGEPGHRFYLIESGRLDAVRGDTLLTEMVAGDCFGEIALLRDVPRTATVVAREDSVLQSLERSDFLAAVGVNPDAYSQADRLVSRRITH